VHVLFVIDTWGLIGGTERHAAVVVPALLERGHRVSVLCREDHRPSFADVPTFVLPALVEGRLAPDDRRTLAARLSELCPDVVFVSACRSSEALGLLSDGARVVRYVHDHSLFCPGLNKEFENGENCREGLGAVCLQRYFLGSGCAGFRPQGQPRPVAHALGRLRQRWDDLALAARAARVLTNSRYMRDQLLLAGLPSDRIEVLYLFTRSNTPDQPQRPLPPATAEFVARGRGALVLCAARLVLPDKGVDFLITALGNLQQPFHAVIAGSGPAEEWLREKTRAEGLAERVHFTGWLESGAIETLYARADVVVCPSVWDEPFGLVGIEAYAHGKPVVGFDVGGVPEWLIDGQTGFLVPRKDTSAMGAAIDRLLGNPALRARLGAAGRALERERFSRERHLDAFESVLRAAAGVA
jgi:glycosyltransferase involved in cell wall biosynthesis